MTDPVSPIGPAKPASAVRRTARRPDGSAVEVGGVDGEGADDGAARNLPVVTVTPLVDQPAPPRVGVTAYAAQVMGQGGQKRGLRGGPETLYRARSTYLETEWSGPSDRRIPRGQITKTDI